MPLFEKAKLLFTVLHAGLLFGLICPYPQLLSCCCTSYREEQAHFGSVSYVWQHATDKRTDPHSLHNAIQKATIHPHDRNHKQYVLHDISGAADNCTQHGSPEMVVGEDEALVKVNR